MRYTFSRTSEQAPAILHSVSEVTAVWATVILKQGSRVFQLFSEWFNRDYEQEERRRKRAHQTFENALRRSCSALTIIAWKESNPKLRITLTNTIIEEICVRDANFSDAILIGIHFKRSCLYRACFQAAALDKAIFEHVDLVEADFRGARLRGVSFLGVDLSGADFSEADLTGAYFTNVKADNVKGIVIHSTPPAVASGS